MVNRRNPWQVTNGGGILQTPSKIGLAVFLAGVLTTGSMFVKPTYAEEEWRVGGMLQIPFGGSQSKSFVHFADTRVGVKVQYATVDDTIKANEQIVERVYQGGALLSSTVASESVVTVSDGGKVVGGEGYLMVAPFNGYWDFSGGINGFAGQETVQGAAGFGFDPSLGGYLQLGALMPYCEAGLRLNFRYVDYFIGATSLPKFKSKTVWQADKTIYKDTTLATPEVVAPQPAPEPAASEEQTVVEEA